MNADATRRPGRSRRRVSLRTTAGMILVCAGLAVSAWLGWEYWGTTWVAHRTQATVMSSIEDSWRRGKDSAVVSQGPGGRPVAAGAIVRIPRFGPDFAVPVLEGTSDGVLAAGLGHYAGSAPPGGPGNYALAGHRVTHGQPLRDMPELRPGDRVVVETRQSVFTYVLDTGGDALVVPFTAGWVLDPAPSNPDGGIEPPSGPVGRRLITLTTCSELFHTDNRYVAFGHLESTRRRP
ncbi:class E sortase [Nocardioides sp. CER19]|uniref:class E sortase n=1 Tax=Nocardioides sp. CER19 TaxID=3038538 RepID=UPI00244712EC|nr:class E sortase [Nocardioides sp. CER19]MDH2414447.1 class E sortase [Nocardioides sp. CER19]